MEHEHLKKITVHISRRRDGGLRAWSDDLPGLVLSHKDESRLIADLEPAMEFMLSESLGCPVTVRWLEPLRVPSKRPTAFQRLIEKIRPEKTREFAAQVCHAA